MKKWLLEQFLPMWAKETVLAQCKSLQRENQALQGQNRELRSFIRGMQTGLRSYKRERRQMHEDPQL